MDTTDVFFAGLLAYGIGMTLLLLFRAHAWRFSSWLESRRIDRAIRRRQP